MKLKIVSVSWIDAEESAGWITFEKKAAWVIKSVGYLVDLPKNKMDFVTIANSYLPDTNQWSGVSRIPKGMVLRIENLLTAECGYYEENSSDNSRRSRSLPVRQYEI